MLYSKRLTELLTRFKIVQIDANFMRLLQY